VPPNKIKVNANGCFLQVLHSKFHICRFMDIHSFFFFCPLYTHSLIPFLPPRCLWYAILRINWGLWSCAQFNSVFWQGGPCPGKTNMPTDTRLWHAHTTKKQLHVVHSPYATESESALLQPLTEAVAQVEHEVKFGMLNVSRTQMKYCLTCKTVGPC